jgi:hypothetical protein
LALYVYPRVVIEEAFQSLETVASFVSVDAVVYGTVGGVNAVVYTATPFTTRSSSMNP